MSYNIDNGVMFKEVLSEQRLNEIIELHKSEEKRKEDELKNYEKRTIEIIHERFITELVKGG